jgi:hypothetical protein
VRIDPSGARTVIATGLSFPSGMTLVRTARSMFRISALERRRGQGKS